jgi:alkanesulfonate monooxygenase SsuD/methylene tetrahydromethanopterin reductase-like flavin-dependent oxidoreductase (luciferase family)
VGGQGPTRTPRLAGTFADEFNHFIADVSDIAPKIAKVRRAAQASGRDPNSITMSVMGPVLVGTDEADYRRKLEAAAAARGDDPEEFESRWASHGIPLGPPSRVAETLAGLDEAGITKFYVQHLDLADLTSLDQTFEVLRLST